MATSITTAHIIVDRLAAHFDSATHQENPRVPQSIWQHCRPSLSGDSSIVRTSPEDFRSGGAFVHIAPTKDSVDISFFDVSTYVAPRNYSFSHSWNDCVVAVVVFLLGLVFVAQLQGEN